MAELSIMKPELFCGGSTGSIAIFGAYKGTGWTGSTGYSADPDIIQGYTGATGRTGLTGQSAWPEGWNAAVDTNKAPTIQDLNAFFYVIQYNLCHIFQEGIGHYLAAKEYALNSFVKSAVTTNGSTGSTGAIGTGATGSVFISVTGSNTGNALSDTTKWKPYYPNKVTTIGYNYTVAWDDYIILWSLAATTSVQRVITLPTASAANEGRRLIFLVSSDTTTTTYSVKINYGGSDIAFIRQFGSVEVFCTGSEWLIIGAQLNNFA